MLTSTQTREAFKEFFRSKGHEIVPSAPMVIKDDPTLMFTNAGMNQFKDVILGNRPITHARVADSQKCLRVSGKHNDLEEVGHDTYHHTMFEMLGNWSFGDYFKAEAIDWAFEFLVDKLGLDADRLYATVFEGYAPDGLERDDEAAALWEKHLPKEHIINGNRHDNFWEMGETGPCGPCSEIHIDLRPDHERAQISGAELVNKDNPQVIEIWNLVFMQYDRHNDGSLHSLPNRVIDTGMGFERLCMALQGKRSNYDTDVFQPLLQEIGRISGYRYGLDSKIDVAMRVAADHLRTIAFAIADGQLPSNAKAGYVIRRILRRAVRYAYSFLGRKEAFLYALVPVLVAQMGEAYPELKSQQTLITKVIREEEDAFLRTLDKGIGLLDTRINTARKDGETEISGKDAFTLYDTYGFPLDLTELILKENGMTLDHKGFEAEMKKQKERARSAAAITTDEWVVLREGNQEFVGYDRTETATRILRYRRVSQKGKVYYQIVLDRTPFYAEMGGQVGDSGVLMDNEGREVKIFDTKRENNMGMHLALSLPENPAEELTARVDAGRRASISANHTATHLLHQALREVLGGHVEQKGSLVHDEGLRFDFSHFQKVTHEELRQVEAIVNKRIRQAIPLNECRDIPIEEAKAKGAMALFGEKYGDKVRVVQYGDSIELCGGTHVANTGNIGIIRILSESSIAAGIRRIEAVSGAKVEELLNRVMDDMHAVSAMLSNTKDIRSAIAKAIKENSELRGKVEEYLAERVEYIAKECMSKAQIVNGMRIMRLDGLRVPMVVKNVAFAIRRLDQEGNYVFMAATQNVGKPLLTMLISDDLVKEGLNAGQIISQAAKLIKGGGGGQPFFAQAGGKGLDGLSAAADEMFKLINQTDK